MIIKGGNRGKKREEIVNRIKRRLRIERQFDEHTLHMIRDEGEVEIREIKIEMIELRTIKNIKRCRKCEGEKTVC